MSDELFSLKNDYAFKKFFTTDSELLRDFINSLLSKLGHAPLGSITLVSSEEELPRQSIDGKAAYLDIVAREAKRAINLEMQGRLIPDFVARSVFYTFRLYVSGVYKGPHEQLRPSPAGIARASVAARRGMGAASYLTLRFFREIISTLIFFCGVLRGK